MTRSEFRQLGKLANAHETFVGRIHARYAVGSRVNWPKNHNPECSSGEYLFRSGCGDRPLPLSGNKSFISQVVDENRFLPAIAVVYKSEDPETAAIKPVFRDAFKYRRCLIPADGFYERKKIEPKQKQAYNFGTLRGSVFAFAGLWDRWRQPDNTILETCAILTTPPNSLVAEIHDRMPAILSEEEYDRWLGPGITDPERVADCLQPFDPKLMKKYPVSNRVNRPENDNKACAEEILTDDAPLNLFEPPPDPS